MKPAREQLQDALASLRGPALRYADVRYTATHEQHVRVRNGEVETLASTVDRAVSTVSPVVPSSSASSPSASG